MLRKVRVADEVFVTGDFDMSQGRCDIVTCDFDMSQGCCDIVTGGFDMSQGHCDIVTRVVPTSHTVTNFAHRSTINTQINHKLATMMAASIFKFRVFQSEEGEAVKRTITSTTSIERFVNDYWFFILQLLHSPIYLYSHFSSLFSLMQSLAGFSPDTDQLQYMDEEGYVGLKNQADFEEFVEFGRAVAEKCGHVKGRIVKLIAADHHQPVKPPLKSKGEHRCQGQSNCQNLVPLRTTYCATCKPLASLAANNKRKANQKETRQIKSAEKRQKANGKCFQWPEFALHKA